jgi:excisionase family DNA binding protein
MGKMLTYQEVAARLSLPKGTIYSMVSRHELPFTRLGKKIVRFDEERLEAWIRERCVEPDADGSQKAGR